MHDADAGAGAKQLGLTRSLKAAAKFVWLITALTSSWIKYGILRMRLGRPLTVVERAHWLQGVARSVFRLIGAQLQLNGPLPARGLLISNHSSYVDILALATAAPCVFVSKHEVRGWPIFGWFASAGGTLYIDRDRKRDVPRLNTELEAALSGGVLVVIFPEGTSSDGNQVLPFRSPLLEVAVDARHELHAMAIRYRLAQGDPALEVCWWGDMTLAGHLPWLLSARGLVARLSSAPFAGPRQDRKQLARDLQALVSELHAS